MMPLIVDHDAVRYVGAPMFANSGYVAEVDAGKCTGCGACAEKCNFSAISMYGDKAVVDTTTCMGCEACAKVCPVDAITTRAVGDSMLPLDLKALAEKR